MESLTTETFNPDMIKAINSEQKRAGDVNYTSVKFTYDGGKIPPLWVDGPCGARGRMENLNYLDLRIPRQIFTHYP